MKRQRSNNSLYRYGGEDSWEKDDYAGAKCNGESLVPALVVPFVNCVVGTLNRVAEQYVARRSRGAAPRTVGGVNG